VSDALTHGWSGLLSGYLAVQLPMLAALARSRAPLHQYLITPAVAAPLTLLAGLGMAALSPWVHSDALGAAVAVAVGYAGGRVIGRPPPALETHRRGTVIAASEAAESHGPQRSRSASAQRYAEAPLGEPSGRARERPLTLAGIVVPPQDEAKHFKMIGTTGTGKSTAIRELLRGALARGDRAVIADPDGGYLRDFYSAGRGDVILNPFEHGAVKWDLFAEIESSYDVDQLARSLIPDQPGGDRSWRGYARTFFTAVTRQLHEAGERDPRELYRLLVVADAAELRTLVQGTPAQPFLDEHNARMFDSIRSVTSDAVGALDYTAGSTREAQSVRRWVRDEQPGVLFIPYRAGQIAALRTSISAWMRLAIFETLNREELPPAGTASRAPAAGNRRLWFAIDELDALGPIDGLKDALARLRKFDGRSILGLQSIAQVSSTYGAGEAHTIIENCGNTVILRASASEGGGTARFASQLIGEREVLRTTIATSRRWGELLGSETRSEHITLEPAVLPSQIEQLPDLAGYLKFASEPQWRQVRFPPSHRPTTSAAPREPERRHESEDATEGRQARPGFQERGARQRDEQQREGRPRDPDLEFDR
jgi:type IV secretory pathway TraG/TraD family ATPase VirD4